MARTKRVKRPGYRAQAVQGFNERFTFLFVTNHTEFTEIMKAGEAVAKEWDAKVLSIEFLKDAPEGSIDADRFYKQ